MDLPSPWGKVNNDIVDYICYRLPIYDIGRLRCVCKRFRAVTSSVRFLQLYSQTPCTRPSLLLLFPFSSLGSEIAYDPTLGAWRNLRLAFLKPCLQACFYPVAASGGLLCFGSGGDFVVCNPITQSWKTLPKVPSEVEVEIGHITQLRFGKALKQALGLYCNRTTGVYELLMIKFSSGSGTMMTITYNSSTDRWERKPGPVKTAERRLVSPNIVACNNTFYSLWYHGSSIVVYCFCQGLWRVIQGPTCTSLISSSYLIDRYGSLHMIGGVGDIWLPTGLRNHSTSVRIWKLNVESERWTEVSRMPRSILDECYQHINFDKVRCYGKDDIIYMKGSGYILMHDFCTKDWKWVGSLMDLDLGMGAVLLEPSLSAAA